MSLVGPRVLNYLGRIKSLKGRQNPDYQSFSGARRSVISGSEGTITFPVEGGCGLSSLPQDLHSLEWSLSETGGRYERFLGQGYVYHRPGGGQRLMRVVHTVPTDGGWNGSRGDPYPPRASS